MTTKPLVVLPRQESGTLPATLVIVLPHRDVEVPGQLPLPDSRDEEPTWEDAEWR